MFLVRYQKAIKANEGKDKKTQCINETYSLFASVFVSRPTGLRSSNVTLTSVRVDWNPVQERFILGYKILVQNIPLNETLSWNTTYADVIGLRSNTRYVISVLPVHGLTDEEHPTGNAAKIIVTTMQEPGKILRSILPH